VGTARLRSEPIILITIVITVLLVSLFGQQRCGYAAGQCWAIGM
jgi:hypothetical protein